MRLSQAREVLRYSEDMAKRVLNGDLPLDQPLARAMADGDLILLRGDQSRQEQPLAKLGSFLPGFLSREGWNPSNFQKTVEIIDCRIFALVRRALFWAAFLNI